MKHHEKNNTGTNKYFTNKSLLDIWFSSKKRKKHYFTKKLKKIY